MKITKFLKRHWQAHCLRESPTKAEFKAMQILAEYDVPFQFQKVIYPFIVDFLIAGKIVLEIDGSVHGTRDVYDDRRSRYLFDRGYEVYRLYNHDVTPENIATLIQLTKES